MVKFKNKKTGLVISETLTYYINKLRNNTDFEEVKEEKPKAKKKVEVEETNLEEKE